MMLRIEKYPYMMNFTYINCVTYSPHKLQNLEVGKFHARKSPPFIHSARILFVLGLVTLVNYSYQVSKESNSRMTVHGPDSAAHFFPSPWSATEDLSLLRGPGNIHVFYHPLLSARNKMHG
jgi:hypothetical protein